jgi:hypothetical protein
MARSVGSVLIKAVLPLAAAGLALAGQTVARAPAATLAPGVRAPAVAAAQGTGLAISAHGLIAPLPGHAAAVLAAGQAAATCATYASRAGWENNGYFGGDLVTAAAICVAESTGNPRLYTCDENGVAVSSGIYPPVSCPAGATSYDRGLWQLNSVAAKSVSDACAFDPVCNAAHAYLFSGRGTSFAPWASYDTDTYARPFLDVVQRVVTGLSAGTVTNALLGECLAQARPARGAKVVVANCGPGPVTQRWTIGGGRLRAGSVCASIASLKGNPNVVLSRCGRTRWQVWRPAGRAELRNAADGKCLTDPLPGLTPGTQVVAAKCVNAKNQTWWLS